MNEENKNNEEVNVVKEEPKLENTTLSTPQSNNEPKVVENVEQKNITEQNITKTNIKEETVKTKKKKEKKGHPVFLVLLIIFLFAFVYFLPDITEYITNYMNEKNGVNELKSGTMTCTYNNSTDNIDYTYKLTFNYEKNRLKKSSIVTTNRLSDTATDNEILTEKETSCQLLKTVLDENDIGMSATCSVSAAVQITTQNIDYKNLNMDFITANIAEFEGFYPEYDYNQSVSVIENTLENNGYTCERIEK